MLPNEKWKLEIKAEGFVGLGGWGLFLLDLPGWSEHILNQELG